MVPERFYPALHRVIPPPTSWDRRLHQYDRRLLVNSKLSDAEDQYERLSFMSIGYPAWNLMYYSLLCTLPVGRPAIVIETGTNIGNSTIVLAQAIRDSGREGRVYTIEFDPQNAAIARKNIDEAGLSDLVESYIGDSTSLIRSITRSMKYIDFAFLDAGHDFTSVMKEFRAVCRKVRRARGMIYFDNTLAGDVALALRWIRLRYWGNIIEFANCSSSPPGNAIWQPRWPRT